METITKIAWLLLALIHLMPASIFFFPKGVEILYGVVPDGDIGILLIHRSALFLAVFITALYAIFDPGSRRLASLVLGISMIGFLIVYMRADAPVGPLRKIAIADIIGVLPLIWVSIMAWRL